MWIVTLPTNLRPEVTRYLICSVMSNPRRKHLKHWAGSGRGGRKQSRPICGQKCKAPKTGRYNKRRGRERRREDRRPDQSAARNTCEKQSRNQRNSRGEETKKEGGFDKPNQSAAGQVKKRHGKRGRRNQRR